MVEREAVSPWPVIVLTLILAGLISVLGMISGPRTSPQVAPSQVLPTQADPRITDAHGAEVSRAATGTYEIEYREISVDLGPVEISASLVAPIGAPPGPGVLFIHGAGTVDPDAFTEQVQGLASAGVYALVPAKRMDTYSTRQRDYAQMATDYLKSWEALREVPGVDPARVGIYGESEGAWIAPIAGALEPEVDFVILASAPVVSPREQAAYAVANYLFNTNVPHGMFRSIPRALGATIPGGGFEYIDFDVLPYYADLTQPVLMLYGTADPSMPIVQGQEMTRDALARAGNSQLTARYLAGADHGLKRNEILDPQVVEILADWVWGLPRSAQPAEPIAGAPAHQRYQAGPVSEPRWYASGDFLVYSALAVLAVALGGLGLTAGAGWREMRLSVRLAAATVLASLSSIMIFAGYIAGVATLALNYQTSDIFVHGGWVLVQVSGLFAVGVLAYSLRETHRDRMRIRTRRPVQIGVSAAHMGALGLLLTGAYWGLFPVSW